MSSQSARPCRNAVADKTFPYALTSTEFGGKTSHASFAAEFVVNAQYQVSFQSSSLICVMPGTVHSRTPPGFRMR